MANTIDLLAFAPSSGDQTLFSGGRGQSCTGRLKLAQRWLLEFFTESGSVPYASERGCDFLRRAREGGLASELDVFQAFALAAAGIRRNLVSEETDANEDKERFVGAVLQAVTVQPGSVSLQVGIQSRAGQTFKVLFPITVRP